MPRLTKRILTLPEASVYIGRTVWALRHMVNSGKVPCVRWDKKIQFDLHDLDKFIEQSKRILSD